MVPTAAGVPLQAVCQSNEGLEAILGTDSAYELWVRFGSEGDEAASLINGLEAAAGALTVSCVRRHACELLVQSYDRRWAGGCSGWRRVSCVCRCGHHNALWRC